MAWVDRSRTLTAAQQAAAEAKRAAAAAAAAAKADASSDEEDGDEDGGGAGGHSAAELAGMKVKHAADDLDVGETMILTMEDRGILDERGNLVEEDAALENILVVSLG